jgi:hypothetical protein
VDVSGLCGREELPLVPVPNRLPPTQPGFVSLRGISEDGRLSGGGREEDEDEDGSGGVSLDEKRRGGRAIVYASTKRCISIYISIFWLAFAWKSPAGHSSVL